MTRRIQAVSRRRYQELYAAEQPLSLEHRLDRELGEKHACPDCDSIVHARVNVFHDASCPRQRGVTK
jgi:hypothetical protein